MEATFISANRRTLLKGIVAGLAVWQTACSDGGHSAAAAAEFNAAAGNKLAPQPLPPPDPLLHLLKRTRFGVSRADFDRIRRSGASAYVDEQLRWRLLPDAAELLALVHFPLAHLPAIATGLVAGLGYPIQSGLYQQVQQQLRGKTLFLATYSERQLCELMVDFWSNHFNIPNDLGDLVVLKADDDRDVIRAHALGRFRDLLGASARSPAMLVYLDNASNTRNGPNENYARELMELHTLGVDGGFNEGDVKEVARCFTGWTVDSTLRIALFRPELHDNGEKTVLGQRIAAGGGTRDGDTVLDLLAAHPSTARHIARKLVRRFVSDAEPEDFVASVAGVFQQSGGDIPTVLRALLLDPRFNDYADEKLQRPLEYLASAVRALVPEPLAYHGPDLLDSVTRMAQAPHGWRAPNGYPDSADYWLSTTGLLERWNFAAALAESRNLLDRSHVQNLVGGRQSAAGLVDMLAQSLLQRPLLDRDRDALVTRVGEGNPERILSGTSLRDYAEAIAGLLLASPYFQLR
ncbi:MAG: DUF1800 domain-containing protein [Nevskiales bacterium]